MDYIDLCKTGGTSPPRKNLHAKLVGRDIEPAAPIRPAAPPPDDLLRRTGAIGYIGPRSLTPRYIGPICKHHHCAHPCMLCLEESKREEWLEEQRLMDVRTINERNMEILAALEEEERKQAIRRVVAAMTLRCHHDRVPVDCADCQSLSATYDKEIYRREIDTALRNADLRAYRVDWKTGVGTENEATQFREKAFDDGSGVHDIIQMIDVAVWQASLHYGPRMNGAIAGVVAKNTIAEFQQNLIEDVSILAGFEWRAMGSEFRQQAEALFNSIADIDETRFQKLQTLARSRKGDDWKLAQKMVVEYGQRRSRFESINEPVEENDGGDFAVTGASAAEFAIHEKERLESQRADGIDMEKFRPQLEYAVRGMRGAQRAVAEAILDGTFTARDVPGVPKSTAARLRPVVLRIFKDACK